MKIQLENIHPDENSSFRLLLNPKLNDLFFWHFHPEYELVYIEGANGTRHVGEHTSQYSGSDLVFIGSNIPHLNFDYGVQTDYEKVVLHIHPSFKNKVFKEFPELNAIYSAFEESQHGLAYSGETKRNIGQRLKSLNGLSPFEQFLEILSIFQILARSTDKVRLHDQAYVNQYSQKEQDRLRNVYTYVDGHYQHKISVDEVAGLCNLSKSAFCRYFKKATRSTFVGFLNQYRISQAKRLLLMDRNVSEACYECGFESLSYFNRTFKKITLENPTSFKNRYLRKEMKN